MNYELLIFEPVTDCIPYLVGLFTICVILDFLRSMLFSDR